MTTTLLVVDVWERDDDAAMSAVYHLTREASVSGGRLFVSLECISRPASPSAPLGLSWVQSKVDRAYVSAMEACPRAPVTVIPPIPHRKRSPAEYLRPDRIVGPNDIVASAFPLADFGALPPLPVSHGEATTVHGDTCLGGTFDRLHAGHKLMLAVAAMVTEKLLYVGLTDISMVRSKKHREMIQPYEDRRRGVVECIAQMNPELRCEVSPLVDPWGPSVVMSGITAIVVSQETTRGASQINEKRAALGMCQLEVIVIDYVPPPRSLSALSNDGKLSSTALREEDSHHSDSHP